MSKAEDCGLTAGGVVRGRGVITRDVTLLGAASATVLESRSAAPYQATLDISNGAAVTLRDVTVAHSSPSVANNYALYCRGGRVTAERCSISSETGSGIGAEGGTLSLRGCRVAGCARGGLVLAADLETAAAAAVTVAGSRIEGNGGSGIAALEGTDLRVEGSAVVKNKGFGLDLRVRLCPHYPSYNEGIWSETSDLRVRLGLHHPTYRTAIVWRPLLSKALSFEPRRRPEQQRTRHLGRLGLRRVCILHQKRDSLTGSAPASVHVFQRARGP